MAKQRAHSVYEFDGFRLDPAGLMLYSSGKELPLPPKVVKTLAILVENRGQILSKDELMEQVWDDAIVEESNLSQYLYLLRKTVGNKPDGNPYIETLRRRGYRFTADVKVRTVAEDVRAPAMPMRPALIGRESEIAEVTSLLSRDEPGFVTVTGVGGVGKTSLARAVAERWSGIHEVFFVELAAINQPDLVVSAIAAVIGVKESPETPPRETVKANLQSRSVLLILDNFEQVAAAAPVLADLMIAGIPGLKLLVTSRIALGVELETVYVLQPLSVPAAGKAWDDALAACGSIRLFAERAKSVQPKFELTPENGGDVARICQRLDGIPLAIELAAARMNFMSPKAVLGRLERQLDILKNGASNVPKRQQTMRETIAWSYHLLPECEKRVFARLGIFSGGFDLEAAESVCSNLAECHGQSVLDVVASLVRHNLLVARTAKNGDPRIHALEVVREFAVEALAANGEQADAGRAHAEHFLNLGETAEPQLVAARSAEWLDRLETEHDNLREALAWSKRHDPLIGQRLAGAIWRFWWLHGHVREACEQLDIFLELSTTDQAVRAKLLTGATFLHRLAGRSDLSRRYAEEGVKISDKIGDLRNGALSYNQLGFLALDAEDYAKAERMFDFGLRKAQELGDIQILALLNNGLGELSRSTQDYDRAANFYGRALEYNRQAGDRVRQTTCLINLGATALMRDDRDGAGYFYRKGLEIGSEMEDMNGTLYCLEGLAGSYWAKRDPKRAAILFGAASLGRRENNLLLEPADKVPYESSVRIVRDALGERAFEENYTEGEKIGLKAATQLALEEAADAPEPAKLQPEQPSARGSRIVVQRQGNVLRLVDWSEAADEVVESKAEPAAAPPPRRKAYAGSMVFASVGAALLLTVVSGFVWLNSRSNPEIDLASEQNVIRLTNGIEVMEATISPDGKYFVYHEPDGKLYRMWLQQTGHSTRHEIIPASERIPSSKTFSPDGQYIYFLASDGVDKKSVLYRVLTLGGPVTKVMPEIHSAVSFSPDGRQMVYYRHDADGARYVTRANDGNGEEKLLINTTPGYGSSAWSPDGRMIAVVLPIAPEDITQGCYVAVVKPDTGSLIKFSGEVWNACVRLEWAPDSRGFYMIGTRMDDGMTIRRDQVFYISYPQGISRKITSDGSRYQHMSLGVTRNGDVFAVPFNRASQMWAMDSNGDVRTASPITSGQADGRSGIAPLADGRVAYISRIGENLNVWIINQDGSDPVQITDTPFAVEELRSGGDGRYLVYSGYSDYPRPHLFRMNIDGTGVRQITSGPGREIDSSFSYDGKWIAYDSTLTVGNKHETTLWKQSVDTDDRVRLFQGDCQMPHFSPDDKYISCVRGQQDILILSSTDGALVRTLRVPPAVTVSNSINFGARWTPDGKSVAYIVNEKGVSNIWTHPIDGGEPKRLTDFTSGSIYHFAYSLDSKRLFVARGNQMRDAILISFNKK